MTMLTAGEILDFAVKIEENGEECYKHAADTTDNPEVKDFFLHLAQEEKKHAAFFSEMKEDLDVEAPAEKHIGDFEAYVTAYVDNVLLCSERGKEVMMHMDDVVDVINFAIKSELDTILYYHESKRFIAEKHHELLDQIIEEERSHFMKLLEVKKRFNGGIPA